MTSWWQHGPSANPDDVQYVTGFVEAGSFSQPCGTRSESNISGCLHSWLILTQDDDYVIMGIYTFYDYRWKHSWTCGYAIYSLCWVCFLQTWIPLDLSYQNSPVSLGNSRVIFWSFSHLVCWNSSYSDPYQHFQMKLFYTCPQIICHFDLEVLVLGNYFEELLRYANKILCPRMFTKVLFIITKSWK